ncbi:hypothetical protein WHR41_05353 [Cladosporium halotolerans]|uniref:Uncharacterized protein n=1 Tax=Cladosporium halotolerans TaxID=1052096 RepID=A0AB34KMX3_9PEZI
MEEQNDEHQARTFSNIHVSGKERVVLGNVREEKAGSISQGDLCKPVTDEPATKWEEHAGDDAKQPVTVHSRT